jgi:hypothetical protein
MSALKFAVSALNREKPHVKVVLSLPLSKLIAIFQSSITDWVEILTSSDDTYDGYAF